LTLSAGTRLGTYEIVGPLGSGGMGEVYRARDNKLKRDVAIKVLPAEMSNDAESLARFEREALAVASLSHPNILAIHDFGRENGSVYAVTELLEGDTLRGRMSGGALPRHQALGYALQIAAGLAAAHEKGVVHRDLKPENVFVTRAGHVKILDFGLAKKVEETGPEDQTSAPTGADHTAPGTVLGTAGYMSPEQVRGLAVDHRSDIFSFGTILYEMLSGKRAFKRDTPSDTMAAIMRDEPPELSDSGRDIPVSLDHIVKHCLEKDRNSRFQSARDVAFALTEASAPSTAVTSGVHILREKPASPWRKLAIVGIGLVVLAAAALLFWKRPHAGVASGAPGVKRVAVLPFENLGAPEDDYFADGIADQVRGKLTSLPGVEVIARGSSTPYKKTTKTPQEIAKELSANYLLTATVRWQKAGGASRVQVNPELVEIKSDGPPASKWQQPFDAALTDVFQVQSDIASKVAGALGLALGEGQRAQLSEKPTQNLAAYDAFLKGDEASAALSRNDAPSLRRALVSYEQAVALDPQFALAWSRISQAYSLLYGNGTQTAELAGRARDLADKAIALAPNGPYGYEALALYYRLVAFDAARAREQYSKGLQLEPGNSDLMRGVGRTEAMTGHWEEALERFRQAERLDPRGVSNKSAVGDALQRLRRTGEARESFERLLTLAPNNLNAIEALVMTYLQDGDLPGARAAVARWGKGVDPDELVAYIATFYDLVWVLDADQMARLRRLTPASFDDNPAAWAIAQAQASQVAGDAAGTRTHAEQAVKSFDEQLVSLPKEPALLSPRALALAYLGRKEEALREGERAVALGGPDKDAQGGTYYLHQLARIEILTGEHEKALDHIERLLKIPYYLSPGVLRIDPNFDPLRKNPRFQKLVASAK
jgi:TolB-like protein/Flp pilus assembly protein TadD